MNKYDLTVREQFDKFKKNIASIVVRQNIVALDLEPAKDNNSTNELLIYLSPQRMDEIEEIFVWRLYAVKKRDNSGTILCSNIEFCYGLSPDIIELPDKNLFDQKCSFCTQIQTVEGLSSLQKPCEYCVSPEKIESVINNPIMGFKNAIGQTITDIDFLIYDGNPLLNIGLAWHYYFHGISVSCNFEPEDKDSFYLSIDSI